jgi:hypothetical protein
MTLPMHALAAAIQADRERELRNRRPRTAGVPSGRRHPRLPELELLRPGQAQPVTKPAIAGSR